MASLEHFKDRETAIAAFDRLWDAPSPWILAFTGMSGQGKSTLLDWLEANRCQTGNLPYALIGIGEYTGQIRAAFDGMLESPTANLRRHLSPEILQIYKQKRESALEDRNRRKMELHQQQIMRDSADGEQQMLANLTEAFRAMEAQADELVFEAWLNCLEGLSGQARVVLLLDNYDTFQDSPAIEDLKRFWQVMERAKSRLPGLRIVLACRERIRHQNDLRAFHNGLADDALLPLMAADSEKLLASMGVTDPAYCQAVFAKLAQGHPLITEMAANAWLESAGGISAEDVPRQTSREEAVGWVQGRILDRLSGPLKEAVRWSALLRWFNADIWGAILGSELSTSEFRTLTSYAFMIRPRLVPQAWACHDLVRRVQISYLQHERPSEFKAFQQKTREYFVAQSATLDALYHLFFIDQKKAFVVWKEMEGKVAAGFNPGRWSALIEIGLAPELQLPDEWQAEVYYRAGRRHFYQAKQKSKFNELDAALDSYDQALKRFKAIGDLQGQVNVLKAINEVHQIRKIHDTSQDSYG